VLPAVLVSLVPKCPACWSVYAGVSSALGIGFTVDRRYLLPLTALLLALALGVIARRAVARRQRAALLAGAAASLGILLGKFALDSDWLAYGGVALLVAASLWRARPTLHATARTCPARLKTVH
jgi:uncharacterized protein YqgC (DUF456 family)